MLRTRRVFFRRRHYRRPSRHDVDKNDAVAAAAPPPTNARVVRAISRLYLAVQQAVKSSACPAGCVVARRRPSQMSRARDPRRGCLRRAGDVAAATADG